MKIRFAHATRQRSIKGPPSATAGAAAAIVVVFVFVAVAGDVPGKRLIITKDLLFFVRSLSSVDL